MPKITPHEMALAGLLHDIQTFMRLASQESSDSKSFIQDVIPKQFHRNFIESLAHQKNPTDTISRILSWADKFAVADEKADHNPKPLVSIFSQLGSQQTKNHYLPIHELSLNKEHLFPTEKPIQNSAYKDLWNKFKQATQAISNFQNTDIAIYIEALQSVLARFWWCVPCGYEHSNDISLYDHSRVVASLASCLSVLDDAQLATLEKENGVVATFIEGDISGIQRFIYSVPMKGATKQLRARSLYLQLLTDVIARYILRQLGMPMTNLIYAGGGHFYLLAPKDTDVNALRREIDRILLKHHDGELYVALGAVKLRVNDFSSEKFHEKWGELKQNTGLAKNRRYAQLPIDELIRVFHPRPQDGQDEFSLRYYDRGTRDEEDERESTSTLGKSLTAFAKKLQHAEAIVLGYTSPHPQRVGAFGAIFAEFGFQIDLIYTEAGQTYYPKIEKLDYAVVQGIRDVPNQQTINELSRQLKCPTLPSLRYTVNITPRVYDYSRPASFDELAEASDGIQYIGVLRMDVDNLGQLFTYGFKKSDGKSRASLARVATLSNALSLYFEGWVGEICRDINQKVRKQINTKKDKNRKIEVETIYPVYSGGDDLFIVGCWDVLPKVAQIIHDDFATFACQNPEVHISAGITLHKGKYPLYLAAEEADGALSSAKKIDKDKNAISFLGQPVKWSEWNSILETRDELVSLVKEEKVSRSLIQMILHFYGQYEEAREKMNVNKSGEQQIVWGAWMWRSAYQFTRFADRLHDEHLKRRIMELYRKLNPQSSQKDGLSQNIQLMGIAARWADALTRNDKEN